MSTVTLAQGYAYVQDYTAFDTRIRTVVRRYSSVYAPITGTNDTTELPTSSVGDSLKVFVQRLTNLIDTQWDNSIQEFRKFLRKPQYGWYRLMEERRDCCYMMFVYEMLHCTKRYVCATAMSLVQRKHRKRKQWLIDIRRQ
jgi:hypothetical protein